ncbi:MAG: hypothetical protein JW832_16145 [Deltaproteobacteria bacterium]|nr:hypothetical protein [Deltaproteobacteria bacterium]
MDTLDDFKETTDKDIDKKHELEQKADTLDGHIQKIIEQRDNAILEMLSKLQGDASAKVKAALNTQAQKKADTLDETNSEIDYTAEVLSHNLKALEDQLCERKEALGKIEQLGKDADIDVTESLADVSAEIEEMKSQRDKIQQKLHEKARTSGRAIVI